MGSVVLRACRFVPSRRRKTTTPDQLVDTAGDDLHVRLYTERHVESYAERHIRLYTDRCGSGTQPSRGGRPAPRDRPRWRGPWSWWPRPGGEGCGRRWWHLSGLDEGRLGDGGHLRGGALASSWRRGVRRRSQAPMAWVRRRMERVRSRWRVRAAAHRLERGQRLGHLRHPLWPARCRSGRRRRPPLPLCPPAPTPAVNTETAELYDGPQIDDLGSRNEPGSGHTGPPARERPWPRTDKLVDERAGSSARTHGKADSGDGKPRRANRLV